jgi:surfeit locus 1 family protein
MPFRPTFWPTLFTIPALILLLGLGSWQVQRLFEKEAMIADREARITADPVELPAPGATGPEALAPLEFRRAVAAGEFLHDQEFFLAARTMRAMSAIRS